MALRHELREVPLGKRRISQWDLPRFRLPGPLVPACDFQRPTGHGFLESFKLNPTHSG
jgi:hypothetical protein